MSDRRSADSARKECLLASNEMAPVQGTVDVDIPAEVLWREFTRANYWPRWNKCFFWCKNKTLQHGSQLIWCFEPIRRWMLYKFPAIARIDEVEPDGPKRKVTWEVVALPGFYARHTYSVEDLGDGRSRFGSWEKAYGWSFRLMRWFWLAHFTFVRDESLKGATVLEEAYKKSGKLDVASLPRRSYLLFWLISLFLAAALAAATWFYVSYIKLTVEQLAPGVYAVLGGGSNSLVLESNGKKLVVDTKFSPGSGALNSWLEDTLPGPVDTIINTHYHYDHTQGNVLYPESRIIAHRKTPALMLARDGSWWRAGRTAFIPKQITENTQHIKFGDIEILIELIGPAHTHGDLVVILPKLNIVVTGDLVFNTYYPFFDEGPGGADIPGLVKAIRNLAERFPRSRFLPGHGPIASSNDILHYAAYLEKLYHTVVMARRNGHGVDEVFDKFDMNKWGLRILPSFHNYNLTWATRTSNIRAVYKMVSKSMQ